MNEQEILLDCDQSKGKGCQFV